MHRHHLGALFWPPRDLFSEQASDDQETAVGEVHTPIQADWWEEQAIQDYGCDKVADDEVDPVRAPAPAITEDFEPALEQPATVASTCARACNMNLANQGRSNCGPQTGRPSTHQRTSRSACQSEPQSVGSRQTTAIHDMCVLFT